MSAMDRRALNRILNTEESPAFSFFIPRPRHGVVSVQSQLQIKNAFALAEEKAAGLGLEQAEVDSVLTPAKDLMTENFLWGRHARSLVMFSSRNVLVIKQVPFDVDPFVHVGDRFYIKPLIDLFNGNARFYIVTLSKKQVGLLECSRDSIKEVFREQFLETVLETERSLQFSSGAPSSSSGGRRQPLYHGHAKGIDDHDVREREFLKRVDGAITEAISDHASPLVIAAVDRTASVYRQVSRYPGLVEENIPGNPEETTPDALLESAWPLVRHRFRRRAEKAVARFRELTGTEWSSDSIERVVPAACNSRIDTLLVSGDVVVWGDYDHRSERVSLCPSSDGGARDLLNFAAVNSLRKGADVYLVSAEHMPTREPVAALFRYPRRFEAGAETGPQDA